MNRKPVLIGAAILTLLVVLALLFRSNRRSLDWRETYDEASKSPYGTFVIHELLKDYYPEHSFTVLRDSVDGQLPIYDDQAGNYVFIGEAMYLDSVDNQALLSFVAEGNTALISSRSIPYDLISYLYYDECDDFRWEDYSSAPDTMIRLNFNHRELLNDTGFVFKYIKRYRQKSYRWQYIEPYFFCEKEYSLVELGRMNKSFINFARIKYGDGFFYLHTTPLAFTNISMVEKQSLEYANRVFSHLQPGPIYWDRYSRISELIGRRRNEADSGERRLSTQTPLQYILSQPALAWAWYLLLASGLLYLIFRTRRRQRIIPVLERNTNTSLEFLSTIGRLYFIQNNHRQLCLQKTKLFQGFVRERYHLHFREMDDDFARKLSEISEVSEETINKILLMNKNIENSDTVSENTLIEYHQLLNEFYRNGK